MYARASITTLPVNPSAASAFGYFLLVDGVSFLLLSDGVSLLQLLGATGIVLPITAYDAKVSVVAVPAT